VLRQDVQVAQEPVHDRARSGGLAVDLDHVDLDWRVAPSSSPPCTQVSGGHRLVFELGSQRRRCVSFILTRAKTAMSRDGGIFNQGLTRSF
jgi:hypothetical protein